MSTKKCLVSPSTPCNQESQVYQVCKICLLNKIVEELQLIRATAKPI